MLEEILESRFMIKKAMKDYKHDAVCYQLSDETIELGVMTMMMMMMMMIVMVVIWPETYG